MATKDKKTVEDIQKEIDKTAKLFDVARPGATPASTTSRPVIVGHTPMIKNDPMVNVSTDDPMTESTAPKKSRKRVAPKVIPVPEQREPVVAAEPEVSPEQAAPVASETTPALKPELKLTPNPEPAAAPEPAPEPPKPTPTKTDEPEPKPDDSVKDAVIGNLTEGVSSKREEQKIEEALNAKREEIEKLINSKQYFVPIGQESRKRSNRRVVVLALLVLIAATAGFLYLTGQIDPSDYLN